MSTKEVKKDRQAKVAEMRAAEKAAARRRTITISVIVGVIIVALTTMVVLAITSSQSLKSAVPQNVQGTTITVGDPDAPVTVDLWEDFQCPACEAFENQGSGQVLADAIEAGDVKVNYHLMTFLGPESVRAANAAAAAVNESPEKFQALHDYLYDNQPIERSGGYDNDFLVQAGSEVGLTSEAYVTAVQEGHYTNWVEQSAQDALESGVESTPTVEVQGRRLDNSAGDLDPTRLQAIIDEALDP